MSEDNNGKVFSEIEEMLGEDGAEKVKQVRQGSAITATGKNYTGVLQRLAVAVAKKDTDEQYRQALLLATFLSREDATRVVAALDERRRYGVDITPVVDLITAWSAVAGATGGRITSIVEGITHQVQTLNTSKEYQKMKQGEKKE